MEPKEKREFMNKVFVWFAVSGVPKPEPELMPVWWGALEAFPLHVVLAAIDAEIAENVSRPHPATLRNRILTMDGRPDVETAWNAVRVLADERNSAILTDEMREAWAICAPSMEAGDMIGARMAFKEAYERAVAAARRAHRPVLHQLVIGTDPHHLETVRKKGFADKVLRLPTATEAAKLPPPGMESMSPEESRAKLREMLASMKSPTERMREAQEAASAAERKTTAERKEEVREAVEAFQRRQRDRRERQAHARRQEAGLSR